MQNKKRIIYGFFIFLALMWLCTIISKSIYASKLPIVSTTSPEEKYIEHIVEAEGIVIAGEKAPITALSGLRIERIMVQTGDRVEEGDVLFAVDLEDLKDIINEKETQIAKMQLQIDAINHNKELANQKKALEEERAREDYDAQARYSNTLVGRASEEVAKAEREIEEELENNGSEEASEALRDALQAAAYAEADAKWARDNAIKEAGRRVEDAQLPDNEDSTLSGYQLEITALREDLSKYKEIEAAGGQITAGISGLITDINISEGNRTSDSAVMLFADDDVPFKFKSSINNEQKKYLGLNDKVSLKLEGVRKNLELSVEYLTESSAMPGNYEIYISLPEGIGSPGLSGTLTHSEVGEKYRTCISPYALRQDVGGTRTYVYIVKEREGILGMEYYIESINVKVLDENENWVAIEGGLDKDSRIVESSTIEVKNGDIVRY
ncbi:MAG: biotin/lipoyl-binding protein [Lachnospiraceae bacterium]|nr:biotin/lipoyl-binding protein [Lachnospiraceae bacterium]